MQDANKSPYQYILNFLVNGVLLIAFWNIANYAVITILPSSFFFKYHGVAPVQSSYEVGETIVFESDSEIFRYGAFDWNDILLCRQDDGSYIRFSESNSRSLIAEKRPREKKIWGYVGATPEVSSTCYIVSNVVFTVQYGIEKRQQYIGGPFFIYE